MGNGERTQATAHARTQRTGACAHALSPASDRDDHSLLRVLEYIRAPSHSLIHAYACTHVHYTHAHAHTHAHAAIPLHRIVYFKYGRCIVWDKRCRLDDVFGSQGGRTIDAVVASYNEDDFPPNPPNPAGFDPEDDVRDDDLVAG